MDILIEVPSIGLNIIFDSQEQVLQPMMPRHPNLDTTHRPTDMLPLGWHRTSRFVAAGEIDRVV
jgi:hypothetical protein